MPAGTLDHVRSCAVPTLRTIGLGALAALLVMTTGGCVTGKRPSFADASGDPAIDAVLTRLEHTGTSQFTAGYTIQTRSTGTTTSASVAIAPPSERSVTIGDVRFLVDASGSRTCDVPGGRCVQLLQPERVSNIQVGPDFYASSAAAQLRADAAARSGAGTARTETIAGQPATCVDISRDGGTKSYCALDDGPLARLDAGGTAVLVELTAYSPTADRSLFAPA